jgi:hypothetical protein
MVKVLKFNKRIKVHEIWGGPEGRWGVTTSWKFINRICVRCQMLHKTANVDELKFYLHANLYLYKLSI